VSLLNGLHAFQNLREYQLFRQHHNIIFFGVPSVSAECLAAGLSWFVIIISVSHPKSVFSVNVDVLILLQTGSECYVKQSLLIALSKTVEILARPEQTFNPYEKCVVIALNGPNSMMRKTQLTNGCET
jgi:hypothetical protein